MALIGRLSLQPMRAILSPAAISRSRIAFREKFEPLKVWMKGFEPALKNHVRSSHLKLSTQRCYANNSCNSGIKFGMGSIFGVSVAFGSICLGTRIAYAMDGFDIWGDDQYGGLPNASDAEEDPFNHLAITRKLLPPFFLFLTVLMNWDHPIILVAKVILILFGTKPRPFSVYLFIEQLRREFINQQPFLSKFKSLYAQKVEVEDYKILCMARVEFRDQEFTLIGILGSWWVFPWSQFQDAYSVLRNKVLQNFLD